MRRLVAVAIVMFAAALGGPARADVLIGMAGPMTGKNAWFGEQMERGAALAVADINAAGGVLGQQVQLITVDDFCDPEQAVAAAQEAGQRRCDLRRRALLLPCRDPGIGSLRGGGRPADLAGVDQSDVDRAGPCQRFPRHPRDDADAILAGNYLADHWSDKKIAILHDNTTWGRASPRRPRSS